MGEVVFAWLPVRLSRFNGHHWEYTGRRVWLRYVRKIVTAWSDTFFEEVSP